MDRGRLLWLISFLHKLVISCSEYYVFFDERKSTYSSITIQSCTFQQIVTYCFGMAMV